MLRASVRRVLFLAAVPGCGLLGPGAAPGKRGNAEAEEYAAYDSLIRAKFTVEGVDTMVVGALTSTDPCDWEIARRTEQLQREMPELGESTLEDFRSKNRIQYLLHPRMFRTRVKIVMLSEEQAEEMFRRRNGWQAFYTRYPGARGILRLSRVGFNRSRSQALVYAAFSEDYLAGRGYYLLLTKTGGTWSVTRGMLAWIS